MKKILVILFCLSIIFCLPGCHYSPPEGLTEEHHTYEEVLAFAKSIDLNATVSEKYVDTTNENGWKFREWDAVINSIDCHVASVSDWVWNDGLLAGEFVKNYYRIDTDYDYVVLNSILSDKYSEWAIRKDLYTKYHHKNVHGEYAIYIDLHLEDNRILTDNELEQIWETVIVIDETYKSCSISRNLVFTVPSPEVFFNHHGEQKEFINKNGSTIIDDLSEQGKKQFIQKYREAWKFLETELPVYEVDE